MDSGGKMKRKLGLLLTATLFLLSCSGGEKGTTQTKSPKTLELKKEKICSDDTVLAEGKGIRVTVADYKYTLKLLNPEAKSFFQSHPRELLKRMVNRRLVLAYIEDSGLAKKYGLDREMEEFKKEYLSRKYVSAEARKRLKPITEEDIEKRFKELFPDKDPKKMSKGDKEFIRNELRVKFYDEAVKSIYSEVEKKIEVKKGNGEVVVSCCGIELKGKPGEEEKLKEELLTDYFYRRALKAGYGKNPEFKRMFTEYFAGKAIEVFRKELSKGIKPTPQEVEEFYRKNIDKFKMPDRVKAVVFYFRDKKQAEEAEKLLMKGKSWQEIAKRFGQFNAKEKTYYKDAKDPIGVALFSIGNPKERKPVIISLSEDRYALIYPLKYEPGGSIPLKRAERFIALKLKEQKLREKEEEKLKELWKEYGVKLENLDCLR